MDYSEALDIIRDLTKFGINLGLDRIRKLLAYYGNPQEQLAVIHIGGTNGKGSTAAMITSILRQAGYKVGTFTSPHLFSYRERFLLDGEAISEEEFAQLVDQLSPAFGKIRDEIGESPTEFEVLTAMAFIYFARNKAQIVVLEVGLGGDIDSTNVITQPLLSIITNVTLDHIDYLGSSVGAIALRKSGIIKTQRPIITASKNEEVLGIIREKAAEKQAPLHEVYKEVQWELEGEEYRGQRFSVDTVKSHYDSLYIPLWGQHQVVNSVTALLSMEILSSLGWEITSEQLKDGLARVEWPGRLEIVSTEPLIVLDGAHNPGGIEELGRWLKVKKPRFNRVILVIGMLADKDRTEAAHTLETLVDKVIVTKPNSPRAGYWQELARNFNKEPGDIKIEEDLPRAIESALAMADSRSLVLITGSLYLIGEARSLFNL